MIPKLTKEEAERLLNMLKKALVQSVSFPEKGDKTEFEVIGDAKTDIFIIKIYRGRINRLKYELGARIKKNDIVLLDLHINPGKVHMNPDGTKITGSHWHVYTEEYGRALAFPADDINAEEFIDNTIRFLDKFNVIEKPDVHYQLEMV